MTKQYLDVKQMQHLKNLGVDVDLDRPFTYNDIIVRLPKRISGAFLYATEDKGIIEYREYDAYRGVEILKSFTVEGSIIDAAYNMLSWCIESGNINLR